MVIFLEGTRYAPEKVRRGTRYKYLLSPQITGLGLTLSTVPENFSGLLDATLLFDDMDVSTWSLLSGTCRWVALHVDYHSCQAWIKGDLLEDKAKRTQLGAWVQQLWNKKDRRIAVSVEGKDAEDALGFDEA